MNLKYHRESLDLVDSRTNSSGQTYAELPASVAEWYSLANGLRLLEKYSNEDFHNTVSIPDDRNGLEADDKVVLIIEDDLKFATVLLKQAHQKGFKGIVGATGEAGLLLAERFRPNAIIMDMNLPLRLQSRVP